MRQNILSYVMNTCEDETKGGNKINYVTEGDRVTLEMNTKF
jgi:hypothetical protein